MSENISETIQVIIEIPAFSEPVKYEFDKKEKMLVVDRFLGTAMQYPANYGFVPNTLSEDGDPIDVLVITPIPLVHGCMIKCRPIGMLKMTDESGVDTKVLAVPVDKLTKQYQHVKEPEDLPASLLAQIKHFFEHYKDLEPGKWVKVEGFESSARAIAEIHTSIKRAFK